MHLKILSAEVASETVYINISNIEYFVHVNANVND